MILFERIVPACITHPRGKNMQTRKTAKIWRGLYHGMDHVKLQSRANQQVHAPRLDHIGIFVIAFDWMKPEGK
jgi:hypothetical protein